MYCDYMYINHGALIVGYGFQKESSSQQVLDGHSRYEQNPRGLPLMNS